MTKAAELAALIGSQTALSHRNLIINGAMNVAQRGTSSTARDNYFTVDRIKSNVNNTDNLVITSSQSTTSPDGFSSSYKVNVDTAESALGSNENLKIMYIIEAQNLQLLDYGASGAKTTTLSFYVRSSTTGTYAVSVYANDSGTHIGGTYTINSADTWERKSLTFVGNTGSAITNDNGEGLQIEWFLAAGSDYTGTANTSWASFANGRYANGQTVNLMSATNNNWHITGVQLEIGETATPFEHRTFGDDLADCQRYFQKSYDYGTDIGTATTVGAMYHRHTAGENVSNRTPTITFPVEMRAATTTVVYSLNGTANAASDCGTGFTHSSDSTSTNFSGTDGTHGLSRLGLGQGKDAIIGFHYTADAEL